MGVGAVPVADRRTAMRTGAVALFVGCLLWLAVGVWHRYAWPVLGWLPVFGLAAMAVRACWVASGQHRLTEPTRRFWRHLSVSCGLVLFGGVSNLNDALGGPEPSRQLGLSTIVLYLTATVVVQWSLLRLPARQRTTGDWVRFALDSCAVLVTAGLFAWTLWFQGSGDWLAAAGRAWPFWAAVGVSFLSGLGFVKVAFAGVGDIDRRAMQLLAASALLGAVTGIVEPALQTRPYLSGTIFASSVVSLFVVLAAERQQVAAASAAPPRRARRFSLLPYAAVCATALLLLADRAEGTLSSRVIAAGAVTLTLIVVLRQVTALRDNGFLLDSLDQNLSRLGEVQRRLAHQASHDALTGLPNRVLFEQRLTELLATRRPVSIALIDLDDFKHINDRLGHGVGDLLLTTVTDRMLTTLRSGDTLARLGGDEFAVLLPGLADVAAAAVLTRTLGVLREPVSLAGSEVLARASVGVTGRLPGDSPAQMLRRADVAMYDAKAGGGGRCARYDEQMDQQAAQDARLAADLRHAIDRGQLHLAYQPVVTLPTGTLVGVEALLRWRHPEHGLVPPDRFIRIAERNAMIVGLGRWVLRQACGQAAEWLRVYGVRGPARISVNVSARQLREPGFVAEVAAVLAETGLPASRLILEITETAVFEAGPALDAVQELHRLGIKIALDDFGTGQSSLSLLLTCPVDIVKIDKSFVDLLTSTGRQAVIVTGVVQITNGLALQAVAEGVETAEQAEWLHHIGCRLAQGYHFARPLPAEEIGRYIEAARRAPAESATRG